MPDSPTIPEQIAVVSGLAKVDPSAAIERAGHLLVGDELLEPSAHARLLLALGRAQFELAQVTDSVRTLEDALRRVPDAQIELAARIQVSLALALASGDEPDRARALLAPLAAEGPTAVLRALASSQLGTLSAWAGRFDDAAARFEAAGGVLEAEPGPEERAEASRVLANLGTCHLYLGRLDLAEATLIRSRSLGEATGERFVVASSWQNLGYVALLRGDLPHALRRLRRAEAVFEQIGFPGRAKSALYTDLAEAHRQAGLAAESVSYARRALQAAEGGGDVAHAADAALQLAACLRDAGEIASAASAARDAAALFERGQRTGPAMRARALSIVLETADAPPSAELGRLDEITGVLIASGWIAEALEVRNAVAERLIVLGRTEDALAVLATEPPARSRELDGPVPLTVSLERGAQAVLLGAARHSRAADAAAEVRRIVAEHRQRLGDPELRARSARLGARVRRVELDDALHGGEPWEVLRCEEQWRQLFTATATVTAPADEELAELTVQLRQAAAQLGAEDRADGDALRRVAELEIALRDRSRQLVGHVADSSASRQIDPEVIADALADRLLLELVEHRGTVIAILWPGAHSSAGAGLGPAVGVADVTDAAHAISRSLGRMLRPGLSPARVEDRWRQVEADCASLTDRLLGSLAAGVRGDVVVAPPSSLMALPWAMMLPSATSVLISPSSAELAARRPATANVPARLGVVEGPDLAHAGSDTVGLSGRYDSVDRRVGDAATAAGLIELMTSSSVLHVAAHGEFRRDSPSFSSLRLADGPFMIHELDGLTPPPYVSLAACDTARGVSVAGGPLLGPAAAFVASGAAQVLAPIAPVPDRVVADVASTVLNRLPGRDLVHALAAASQEHAADPIARAVCAATICLGVDAPGVSPPTRRSSDQT